MTRPGATASCFIALGLAATAIAGNLSFLASAPAGKFNDEDLRIQREAALDLLRDGKVGDNREWHNPDSTAKGTITVTKIFRSEEGFHCKTLHLENFAEGLKGRASFPVCEIEAGSWQIHADATPARE